MKLYMKTIVILIVITVIGVSGYFVWQYLNAPEKPKVETKQKQESVDQLLTASVDTDTITANFADGHFVQLKFKLITKSETDAEEIKKISFKTQDAIIQTINQIKMSDAAGTDGFTKIENNVKDKLNKVLGKNVIKHVYLVDKLIQ